MLVEHDVHDVIRATDAPRFLNVRADGVAIQFPGAGALLHHHAVIRLNCRRGGNARHDRLCAAGIASKVVKFDIAGADSEVRLRHAARDVHERSGARRAEVDAVVRVGVLAADALKYRVARELSFFFFGVMPVRAKREYDGHVLIPAACRRELIQNSGQNLIARDGS